MGSPTVDLFASRLTHQILQYTAWKPDPGSVATDAMQQSWKNLKGYAFPPFSLISRVLYKVMIEEVKDLIIITPAWQT